MKGGAVPPDTGGSDAAEGTRSRQPSNRTALVLALCIGVALLRFLPVFIGHAASGPERQFVGLGPACVQDFQWYTAFAYEEKNEGTFFLENRATLEAQDGRFFPVYFVLVGTLARLVPFMPVSLVWVLVSLVTAALFLGAVYRIIGLFLARPAARLLAFALVCFSSGLDYIGALIGLTLFPSTPEAVEAFRNFPFAVGLTELKWLNLLGDLKVGGQIGYSTFGFLYNGPALFAYLLFLLVLYGLVRSVHEGRPRVPVQALILFPLIFFTSSISAVVLYAILFFTPAVPLLRSFNMGAFRSRLRMVAPFLLTLAVPAAFVAWGRGDPVYRAFSRSYFEWPVFETLFFYPLGFGPILVLALLGWKPSARLEPFRRDLLLAWIVVPILLGNNPIMAGYRFLFPVHVPLCILGALGLETLYDKVRTWKGIPSRRVFMRVVIALLCVNNVVLIGGEMFLAARSADLSLSGTEREALWILEAEPKGRVFCAEKTGTQVISVTPHKAYIAHWTGTMDVLSKRAAVARFFDPAAPTREKRALLEENVIDYVVYGRHERSLGVLDPELPLEPIYEAGDVAVYRVR